MRGTMACVFAFLAVSVMATAETELRVISWKELETLPEGASLDGEALKVSVATGGATRQLVVIEDPGIQKERYVVRGRIRYEGVEGDGYLEMWSDFNEGSYFTRTLAPAGPMQKITGSSDWRDFGLLFDSSGAKAPPSRLTINLVLPGKGEVSLSAMTLSELEANEWPMGSRGMGSIAGWWGGLAGAALGICGGLLSWLGSRGRAKRFVLTGLRALIALGVVALALGLLSLGRGLSYEIYYPLLLIGAIAVIAPASALPSLKRRYEEMELRRMRALDVSG
jgi:hypothetical protein